MKIEFDLHGKASQVLPLLDAYPEAVAQLCGRCGTDHAVPFEGLPVRALIEMAEGVIPQELREKYAGGTLEEWCGMLNGIKAKLDGFLSFMRRTTPPRTQAQQGVDAGLVEMTMEEGVLLALVRFYGLHSLEEAQRLTIAEYMIARKQQYNESRMAYNMEMAAAARRSGARGRV